MSKNLETPLDGAEPTRAPDIMTAPRVRKHIPTQLPLLILVLGVSAGALYGMRQYGMRSGFNFDAKTVDYKEQDSAKARTYERIMAELDRVKQPLDVTLTEFGKSPFMRDTVEAKITPDVKPLEPGMSDVERHRAEAVDALKRLKLNSIIGTIARIDDLTVQVGDPVGDLFVVKAIDGRSVTFEAYGEDFTLTMEAPKAGSPKKSPTRMGTGSTRR